MSPWSVGMVSRSWRTEPCSPPVGLYWRMRLGFNFYFLIFFLSSPLLSSVLSRDGIANGAAGQVIFLHESQTEVIFCYKRMMTRSCLVRWWENWWSTAIWGKSVFRWAECLQKAILLSIKSKQIIADTPPWLFPKIGRESPVVWAEGKGRHWWPVRWERATKWSVEKWERAAKWSAGEKWKQPTESNRQCVERQTKTWFGENFKHGQRSNKPPPSL